jgi:hypothetical protein
MPRLSAPSGRHRERRRRRDLTIEIWCAIGDPYGSGHGQCDAAPLFDGTNLYLASNGTTINGTAYAGDAAWPGPGRGLPADGNPEGLSIMHLEFRRAGQSRIPRVALLRTSIPM